MKAIQEYIGPYILSNLIFTISIFLAMKKTIWARFFFAVFFLGAALLNFNTAVKTPEVYLDYSRFAFLPVYTEFIHGYFSNNIPMFVIPIAALQFLIFLGLISKGIWVRAAGLGGFVFGLAIAPLGVGSAFPATVLMSLAFYFIMKIKSHDFIWKLKQYHYHESLIRQSIV